VLSPAAAILSLPERVPSPVVVSIRLRVSNEIAPLSPGSVAPAVAPV
jgi:hypothetical protein